MKRIILLTFLSMILLSSTGCMLFFWKSKEYYVEDRLSELEGNKRIEIEIIDYAIE